MRLQLVTLMLLAGCGPSEAEVAACKVARSKVDAETAPVVASVQERLKAARLIVAVETKTTVDAARELKKLQQQISQAESARDNARGIRERAHQQATEQVIQERMAAGLTGPMSQADHFEIASRTERLMPSNQNGTESDEVIRQGKDIIERNKHLRTVADALDLVPEYERLVDEIEACRKSWSSACRIRAPYQDAQHAQVDAAFSKFNDSVSARAAACINVGSN